MSLSRTLAHAASRFLPGGLVFLALLSPRIALSQGTDPTVPKPLPYGVYWQTLPVVPCDDKDVAILFTTCTCNTQFLGVEPPDSGAFRLRVRYQPDIVCIQCGPDSVGVNLGQLAAGIHSFFLEIEAEVIHDSTSHTETSYVRLEFEVRPDCDGVPPGDLPFVSTVQIGQQIGCPDCLPLACAGDSIPVFVAGATTSPCIRFVGAELLPSPILSPLPAPPILRLNFEQNSCIDIACPTVLSPWSTTVSLPPLPPRLEPRYQLPVEVVLNDVCYPESTVFQAGSLFPFGVMDCQPPPRDCFVTGWNETGPVLCHSQVSESEPAHVTMTISTGVALAGLEGDFTLHWLETVVSGLEITDLRPVGPAAGMHLDWVKTDRGARFVLFADSGAPIPVTEPGEFVPVLEIEASALPGLPVPSVTYLLPERLLASDVNGVGVGRCPIIDLRLMDPYAHICRASQCDFNRDAVADVRDLVLFVHCVMGETPCPTGADSVSLDCDADGSLDLEDVLCCARVVLHGDEPDTSGGRPEPGVGVTLGAPVHVDEGEVQIPIHLTGGDRVGAARLGFTYPADRYWVAGVGFGGGREWLGLFEESTGRVDVGLLALAAGDTQIGDDVEMTLRLRLLSGQTHGGEVEFVDSHFAGRDGVTLLVDGGTVGLPLGPSSGVSLSPAVPNPSRGETSFTVRLTEASDLDVTIYDAAGRRVAQLYRGRAEGGAVPLTWNGRASDGTRVSSGVYILRAVAAGTTATQKIMMLRSE